MSSFISLQVHRPIALGLLSLLASFLVLCVVYQTNVQKGGYKGNDIYFIWSDGVEIAQGQNPYSKIHGSDMLRNNKYTTYLPGFFLVISAYVKLGYTSFSDWLSVWRPASFLIHFSIGVLLFFWLLRLGGFWLAIFGSQFWLLSRWTVQIMNSGQIDSTAILLLLVALALLPNKRNLALIVFGASLSVKQIGIFMLPVFILLSNDLNKPLLWNLKQSAKDLAYIALIPFLLCLPFLIWDSTGLIKSLLFSATRSPGGHIKVASIDELLGYMGIVAKFPMLFLMGTIYFLVLERRVGKFMAALAIFLTFMTFNSVLFKQYMPWFCAFIGLAIAEAQCSRRNYGSG